MLQLHEFANFDALNQAVCQQWLNLITTIPPEQPCSFALAGGTTPEPIYRACDALCSKTNLQRLVQYVATDERWVPDEDLQSNEGLFRRCFTQTRWRLISLKNNQTSPAAALSDIDLRLQENFPRPFNAVILGMGTDGHIASLFPNAPQLLINDPTIACVAAVHPQTNQARVSLSMARLLNTDAIWLVITGKEKRTVLENASSEIPIGALLAAARCDVEVFCCL